jgi:thiosulfate/3-mercaptopyruvate sulfurtransferase
MIPPLISTQELADALLGVQPPIVLDIRWALGGPPGIGQYRSGHITGASFVDLDEELAAPPGPGRHPLPDAATFQAAMRRHGVSASRPVVVYDAGNSTAAARAWWDLKYFGHPDVRVLDGGYAAWVAEGRPIAASDADSPEEPPPEGDFVAVPGGLPIVDAAVAVGAYCGSGVTAAHTVLALAVAGIDSALYVGSWSEWITDPSRPVATGPEAPAS